MWPDAAETQALLAHAATDDPSVIGCGLTDRANRRLGQDPSCRAVERVIFDLVVDQVADPVSPDSTRGTRRPIE
jgi:hypothetical protein